MTAFESDYLPRGILNLLLANGGRIDNRITIQKCAYLLQRKGVPDFRTAGFSYHHYGPYSRDVSEALQKLVSAQFIQEQQSAWDGSNVRYSYELTETGRGWLESCAVETPPANQALFKLLGTTHWRTLELAATIAFLQEEKLAVDYRSAVQRALTLKPDCLPREHEAEQLLESLH